MVSECGLVNDTRVVSMKDKTKMQLYFPFLHTGLQKER